MQIPRTERVGVVLTPEEKRLAYELAAMDERSIGGLVRILIRTEAQRRGLWPCPKLPTTGGEVRA